MAFSILTGPFGPIFGQPDGVGPANVAPTITTTSLPAATVGVAYTAQLTATGNPSSFTWLVTSGNKPAWLTLSTGGLLSGTPAVGDVTTGISLAFSCSNGVLPNGTATLSLVVSVTGTLPLLYESNVTGAGRYLGAFKVPSVGGQANPNNWSGGTPVGSGQFIAYNQNLDSLFISSRNADPSANIGQISIPTGLDTTGNPANMPTASWVGASTSAPHFFDITGGNRAQSTSTGNGVCSGMFTDGTNIYQNFEEGYDNAPLKTVAPLWKRAGLGLTSGTITGPVTWAGSKTQRTLAGAGCVIPTSWQSALGGDMFQADRQYSINSTQSAGPFLSSWSASQVGVVSPLPNNVLCDKQYPGDGETPLWNYASRCNGLAFPSNTRTVLHIGIYGTGTVSYGTPGVDVPADPADNDKGYHAYPYRWRIWAYDAQDLADVKAGTKASNTIEPYSTWLISAPPNTLDGSASTTAHLGACFDDVNKRLFIAECQSSRTGSLQPIIHVFQVVIP